MCTWNSITQQTVIGCWATLGEEHGGQEVVGNWKTAHRREKWQLVAAACVRLGQDPFEVDCTGMIMWTTHLHYAPKEALTAILVYWILYEVFNLLNNLIGDWHDSVTPFWNYKTPCLQALNFHFAHESTHFIYTTISETLVFRLCLEQPWTDQLLGITNNNTV